MKRYALVIDHESCWGCKTCDAACRQEFHTPAGVHLISVTEKSPGKKDDTMEFLYHVNVCRHCDEPPCIEACPEGVILKRQDGIVVLDEAYCTGCRLCIKACPYDAIGFDEDNGFAQKCNLCHHRVDHGLIPACADNVCLAHCITFGDPDEIAERIENKGAGGKGP